MFHEGHKKNAHNEKAHIARIHVYDVSMRDIDRVQNMGGGHVEVGTRHFGNVRVLASMARGT